MTGHDGRQVETPNDGRRTALERAHRVFFVIAGVFGAAELFAVAVLLGGMVATASLALIVGQIGFGLGLLVLAVVLGFKLVGARMRRGHRR